MARKSLSLKQLAINKDQTVIVASVGLAAFIVVFSLVASNALLKQRSYQAKVIGKKKVALTQLKKNVTEVDKLKTSYKVFADAQANVLGGSSTGTGEKDGSNPRLVLDALPSKYDFPALATSLEKIVKPFPIETITGTDDEIAQAAVQPSAKTAAIEIPFSITINASPQSSKQVLQVFEKSIRPIQIQKLTFVGQSQQLKITLQGKTYFQPQKKFDVRTEQVK